MVQLSTPVVTPDWGMGPPWGAFCQITLTSCLVILLTDRQTNEYGQKRLPPPLSEVTNTHSHTLSIIIQLWYCAAGGFQCWTMPRSRFWWKHLVTRPTPSRVPTIRVWRSWRWQSYSRSDDFLATRSAVTAELLVTTFTFIHWVIPACRYCFAVYCKLSL